MTDTAYPLGIYTKGDQTRSAETPADAVQAVFDGFTHHPTEEEVASDTASTNDAVEPVGDQPPVEPQSQP